MEPSIYKPGVYKGAGIYKVGAEGGGGGFKDYLLTQSKTTNYLSDGWFINGGVAKTGALSASPPTFAAICKQDIDISNVNILEIEFAFKDDANNMNNILFYDRGNLSSRIALGWLSGSFTFGIFDWATNSNIFFGSFSVTTGEKYKVKYRYDFENLILEQYVNDNLLQSNDISSYTIHKTIFSPCFGMRGTSTNTMAHGITLYLDEMIIKGDGIMLFTGKS